MAEIKAIYFNSTFNTTNPSSNTQCITYDAKAGFQFWNNGKTITVTSKTDESQSEEITILKDTNNNLLKKIALLQNEVILLQDEIMVLKINTNKTPGIIETPESIATTVITENLINKDKDISLYSVKTEGAKTIGGKSVTIYSLTAVPETGIKNMVTIDSDNDVTVKSFTADELTTAQTNVVTIKSKGIVSINNFTINGSIQTVNTNQVDIQTAEKIHITNSNINSSGYNGIMIGQGDRTVLPSSVIIEGVNFNMEEGQLTNNTINIFATADNAEIVIKDCKFGEASNPIRFGNSTNASGVNVIIENCHFMKWETKRPWCGIILFEAFEDWSLVQKEFPPTADEGNSTKNKDYRKRVLPELIKVEDEQNRFGKDKITVTFKNCTYGNDNAPLVFNVEDYASIFGTSETDQIAMVCRYSGYSSINAAYDEKIKAENGGSYPDGRTWYAGMFPYSDDVNYLEVIVAADKDIELTNKNSDCYPTIIFKYFE